MKSRPRAYDPAISEAILLGIGSAHGGGGEEDERPVGRLLVPDPEQRSGWREFYVHRSDKPGRRPIGFGR